MSEQDATPKARYHESLITCPYCNRVGRNDVEFKVSKDCPRDRQCWACERTFMVTRHVSITYTSEPKENNQ